MKYSKVVNYPQDHKSLFKFFSRRVPIAHVSSLFRRTFFEKAGLYETSGHINNGDTLLWMKGFSNDCIFANIDMIGVKVRVSKDFFSRRSGYDKALSDLKNRFQVIKILKYSPLSYVYAFLVFFVNTSPPRLKKYFYLLLR